MKIEVVLETVEEEHFYKLNKEWARERSKEDRVEVEKNEKAKQTAKLLESQKS